MMLNVGKLRGKIVEKGFSVRRLAEKIGVDPSTLYRQMSKSERPKLTICEADAIVRELSLTRDEAMDIFFSQ